MKKYLCILTILLSIAIFFLGCYPKPLGNFTLKGTLLNKTDSTPVSGNQITVMCKVYKGGFSYKSKIVEVGNGKSDSNGSFEILCDYYNEPGYFFKENDLPNTPLIEPLKEGDIVNLDTLYVTP